MGKRAGRNEKVLFFFSSNARAEVQLDEAIPVDLSTEGCGKQRKRSWGAMQRLWAEGPKVARWGIIEQIG